MSSKIWNEIVLESLIADLRALAFVVFAWNGLRICFHDDDDDDVLDLVFSTLALIAMLLMVVGEETALLLVECCSKTANTWRLMATL